MRIAVTATLIALCFVPRVARSSDAETLTSEEGRPLASLLDQVQHRFLSPITYEEAPSEKSGRAPVLSVTLGSTDTTPYYAAASVLHAYIAAGLPGAYKVVQHEGWVSVLPTQVPPVMSHAVTFPAMERNAIDTLQLIVDGVAQASGKKVILLNVPFWPSERLTLGAAGQPAADVIESIGAVNHRPISFQCLYDPLSKAYYLNVTIVAPKPEPGTTTVPKPARRVVPRNSPWFTKQPDSSQGSR